MRIKKLFMFFMAASFILMNAAQVSAVDNRDHLSDEELQEKMLRLLASVEMEGESKSYGLGGVDFSAVTIGKRIPSYNIEDGQLETSQVELYPLLLDDVMISQFLVSWDDEDGWYAQLDNSQVVYMDFIYDEPIAYIYGDEDIYVCSYGKIYAAREDKMADKEKGSVIANDVRIIEENLDQIVFSDIEAALTLNAVDYLEQLPGVSAEENEEEPEDSDEPSAGGRQKIYFAAAGTFSVILCMVIMANAKRH